MYVFIKHSIGMVRIKYNSKTINSLSDIIRHDIEFSFLILGLIIIILPVQFITKIVIIFVLFFILMLLQFKMHTEFSNKYAQVTILFGLIIFLYMFGSRYEIYLVFIGLMIICLRVFLYNKISNDYSRKMNYFVLEFTVFYLLIISQKIITILNLLQG